MLSESSERPGMGADHQRRGEGPGLAAQVADVGDVDAGLLLEFARDRRLDRFARLDEAGQRRIAARRIMRLAAEQQPAVMLGEHDHDRVDARIMFGAAVAAPARPAAAVGLGRWSADRAKAMAAVPVGKAQRGGEGRRFRRVQQASSWKCARASIGTLPSGSDEKRGDRRRSRGTAADRLDRSPAQLALLVDRGGAIVPDELPRFRVAQQRP